METLSAGLSQLQTSPPVVFFLFGSEKKELSPIQLCCLQRRKSRETSLPLFFWLYKLSFPRSYMTKKAKRKITTCMKSTLQLDMGQRKGLVFTNHTVRNQAGCSIRPVPRGLLLAAKMCLHWGLDEMTAMKNNDDAGWRCEHMER